ncbi:MAG: DUF1573 domain-containing protein [Candidatus Gorgyraea atricola]|nr:DUF1573 domain-containing protein [Candidatus Gorgyraea atricola]
MLRKVVEGYGRLQRVVLVLVIIALLPTMAYAAPKVEIVTEDLELGRIKKAKVMKKTITAKNTGDEVAVIKAVTADCGCMAIVDEGKKSLEPGEDMQIKVKIDTNKVHGKFSKHVYVHYQDPDKEPAIWSVTGKAPGKAKKHGAVKEPVFPKQEQYDQTPLKIFFTLGCNDCRDIMDKFLPSLAKKYYKKISVEAYNIDTREGLAHFLAIQDEYAKEELWNPTPPTVFIDGKFLSGKKEIKRKLKKIIKGL